LVLNDEPLTLNSGIRFLRTAVEYLGTPGRGTKRVLWGHFNQKLRLWSMHVCIWIPTNLTEMNNGSKVWVDSLFHGHLLQRKTPREPALLGLARSIPWRVNQLPPKLWKRLLNHAPLRNGSPVVHLDAWDNVCHQLNVPQSSEHFVLTIWEMSQVMGFVIILN